MKLIILFNIIYNESGKRPVGNQGGRRGEILSWIEGFGELERNISGGKCPIFYSNAIEEHKKDDVI